MARWCWGAVLLNRKFANASCQLELPPYQKCSAVESVAGGCSVWRCTYHIQLFSFSFSSSFVDHWRAYSDSHKKFENAIQHSQTVLSRPWHQIGHKVNNEASFYSVDSWCPTLCLMRKRARILSISMVPILSWWRRGDRVERWRGCIWIHNLWLVMSLFTWNWQYYHILVGAKALFCGEERNVGTLEFVCWSGVNFRVKDRGSTENNWCCE